MKKELDEELCRKYPKLYRQRYNDMRETAMCWGFECGDGWFKILDDLGAELEPIIQKFADKYGDDAVSRVCASQVKEKFGTLRHYMHSETDEMGWLINIAENRSCYTCEDCGSEEAEYRGKLGWVRTLCQKCYFEELAERLMDTCRYDSEVYDKEVTYGEDKGKIVKAVRFTNKDETKEKIIAQLERFFVEEPDDEEEISFREKIKEFKNRILYILKWKIWYNLKGPFNKWWWRNKYYSVPRSIKYKIWKLKRVLRGQRLS